jgi:hypothetical protein
MASQCSGHKNKSRTFAYNFNEKWENKYFFINVNKKCVCLINAWGRGEVFTGFLLGGPKVRDHR